MERAIKKWSWILLFWVSAVAADSQITKVIPVNNISAEQAEQALKPLLQAGETLSHSGNQLIVNVSPTTLTKIRTILHDLDVSPATLGISVHQDQANWLDSNTDNVVYGSNSQSISANSQSVQVSSGSSAFISIGRNVPVVSSVGAGDWNAGVSYERMNTSQGFLVRPQLQGNRVKLQIRRVNDTVNKVNNQEIDSQNIDTTTVIPLNQWVKIGSSAGADLPPHQSSDVLYTAGGNDQNRATLFIKVSVIR
jgi:hypothetical protein